MNIVLRFGLPWPPSANTYWRSMRGGKLAGLVLLSREAREYRKLVVEVLVEQNVPRHELAGSLEVELLAHPPDRRRRDIDNLLKPVLDTLIHAKVIEDDVYVDRLVIERGTRVTEGWLDVRVTQHAVAVKQEPLALGAGAL